MWALRVRIAVGEATGGQPRVPPQGPYTQYGAAAHGELEGRGAVAPVTRGSDFQPGRSYQAGLPGLSGRARPPAAGGETQLVSASP